MDGKKEILTLCSACGNYHKGNHGFEVSADGYGLNFGGRQKLCSKCSRIYMPKIHKFFEDIRSEMNEQLSSTTLSEKTIFINKALKGNRK